MIANNVYSGGFIRRPAAEDGLNFIREYSRKSRTMKDIPTLSVIIPVFQESDRINGIITQVFDRAVNGMPQVIVVDGDPRGSTINAIEDERITKIISGRGRARQMNSGASLASGDILLFLHADTLLPKDALTLITTAMSVDRFVAGAFDLGIATSRRIFRITEKYVFLRTRLTRIPFGDQAIFIRREYFEIIGGYQDIPLMEDVEIMGRIRKRGDRICIIPSKVLTSPRRWERDGLLFSTFRNWTLQMLYALGVPPEQLQKYYQ
ncbi:MAG TPA: TIGR04283 family arsenosugar biosynthesis glycosyltransferase [Nitrospirota bacterium]|nr:TIGR04283 family arsenosugar biosynthesis glycosyltransferase [Nitrospirota bacterium]